MKIKGFIRYINLFLAKLLGQVLKFVIIFYLSSSLLKAEDFGKFSMYLVIISMVYLIVGLGLFDSILYLLLNGRDNSEKKSLLGAGLIYLLVIITFFVSINIFVFKYFEIPDIYTLSFFSAGYLMYLLIKKVCVGLQDYFVMNYFDVILNLVTLVLIFCFANDLITSLRIYSITMFIISLIFIFKYRPQFKEIKSSLIKIFENQKEYGFKVHLSQFISMFTYDTDKIILQISKGFESVGTYNVALNFIMPVKLFSVSICELLMKEFSSMKKIPRKIFLLNNLTALLLSVVVWFLAKYIISSFYGESYQGILNYMYLLPLLSFLSSTYTPINYYFTARGLGKQKLNNAIVLGGANLILNLILVPIFGIPGAFIATIIALLINNVYFIIQYNRYIKTLII